LRDSPPDYVNLNKAPEIIKEKFIRHSVTHPYEIDPINQKLLDKKTMMEQWMLMLNEGQGQDAKELLESIKDNKQVSSH